MAGPDPPFWLPLPGERAIVLGQTGSGKTVLNMHLLQHLQTTPVIIYDTKEEPKFESLPHSRVVFDDRDLADAVDDPSLDYIIHRPHIDLLPDWRALDELLTRHYYDFRGVDAYIDELTQFHGTAGSYGKGLNALYARGRSRGITLLGSSQRPARISQLALSESQHVFQFHLSKRSDRKKVSDDTGAPLLDNPPPYHFWHFRTDDPDAVPSLIAPVPLLPGMDASYTDVSPADPEPEPTADLGHVWIGPRNFWAVIKGGMP
jgi:hypothetical protein